MAKIKPFKPDEIRTALTESGVNGMMRTEIKGCGAQSCHTRIYRSAEYGGNFVPEIGLEIVLPAKMTDQVGAIISGKARTGKIGGGKVFVPDIDQAMRARTGETNEDAL